jgi:hypothetical protein
VKGATHPLGQGTKFVGRYSPIVDDGNHLVAVLLGNHHAVGHCDVDQDISWADVSK